MIQNLLGDLLQTKADVIAHQVNCKGVMGSGIAKQIREKYPCVYLAYRNSCKNNNIEDLLGQPLIILAEDYQHVANLFGQVDYLPRGINHTNYAALEHCFLELKDWMKEHSLQTLAIPYKIGCGLAGGDWNGVVYPMLENLFKEDEDITLLIVQLN